ncbi:MAG: 5'-methylthioadenosine/adenosylhomocysteine nucleosidase [Succinivibrio sp.]|nr:5'-methylthioadenosine/adenosylhomocysteine nucleosidase [Succinivibrio sp.]MDY5733749.1 5'-methylthioadenosine/adenosylhomocysteine nucleosidase [Succinivibrio sp.]
MKVGIICAMKEETEYFLSKLEKYTTKEVGATVFYEGKTNDGKEVVIALAGIGKANAAAVCALTIALYQVNYIINSGIAGSIASGLHIGDVVLSTSVSYHDADFTAFDYKIGQMAGEEAEFNASSELLAKAEIAATTIPEIKDHVKKGLVVSGDQFINKPEQKALIQKNLPNAMVTECEGAPIAQIATKFKVPFIVIRCVSDCSDENQVDTYEFNVKQSSENSAKLVLAMLRML